MPADTPMVLVPRGTANACLAYLDTLDLLALGTEGQRAREGLRAALSTPSTPSTADQVGTEAGLVEAGHVVWWKEGGVNYFPQGEGFSVSRSCRVEPLVTRESALAAIAAARAAPSPGEGDARLCSCGKPALATASICSDCADACLASGEGEAPVARRIRWAPGDDWDFSDEADDPITDADVERLRAQGYVVDRLYTRAAPATLATCQACGGPIEGWICQSCDREFREDDAGNLVFDDDETGEGDAPVAWLRVNLVRGKVYGDLVIRHWAHEGLTEGEYILYTRPAKDTPEGLLSIPGNAGSDGQAAKVSASTGGPK